MSNLKFPPLISANISVSIKCLIVIAISLSSFLFLFCARFSLLRIIKFSSSSEKHIFVLLRYLSNYMYNLSMHTSITYQRISQLQDGFSMVYGKVFGEQAPQMATNISNEELKKSVEELEREI